jgi:hypothetical protein
VKTNLRCRRPFLQRHFLPPSDIANFGPCRYSSAPLLAILRRLTVSQPPLRFKPCHPHLCPPSGTAESHGCANFTPVAESSWPLGELEHQQETAGGKKPSPAAQPPPPPPPCLCHPWAAWAHGTPAWPRLASREAMLEKLKASGAPPPVASLPPPLPLPPSSAPQPPASGLKAARLWLLPARSAGRKTGGGGA